MKPVFMTITHDPPNTWGDCFRACIASILECNPQEIPHPFENGPGDHDQYDKMIEVLKNRFNVFLYFISIREEDLNAFLNGLYGFAILVGQSPRDSHMVVVGKHGIAHNPNPMNDGLSSFNDGTYQFGLICRGVL